MRKSKRDNSDRWSRVFDLRRAIVPHIVMAGLRPPLAEKGETEPQKFVSLTDDLDDVLYEALTAEARIARTPRAARRSKRAMGAR